MCPLCLTTRFESDNTEYKKIKIDSENIHQKLPGEFNFYSYFLGLPPVLTRSLHKNLLFLSNISRKDKIFMYAEKYIVF